MVKKMNAFNIQKAFVAIALMAFTLFFVGKNDVSASTTSNYYVSDPNSAMYGKVLKLYYDNQGHVIEDTLGIAGNFAEYEIYVNKSKELITVYGKDNNVYVPVKRFICSDGGSNTPEGIFYTPAKYRWQTLMGPSYGQWCTRIHGGVLFHSVFYNSKNNSQALSVSAYNKLGTTCSHGCIRLTAGDAKWIYDNCKIGTKVVIYSKGGYEPFSKPSSYKLPSWHTWDPTDPTSYYLCQQRGCHSIIADGLTYDATDNQWRYYQSGVFADWFTSLAQYNGQWWYVKNGVIDFNVNTLAYYNNNWWYVRNGRVDFNANTLGYYNNNWWYVRNGRVDFNANTLGYYNNNWWYVRNGRVDFNANTLGYYNNNWWYVRNGCVDFNANTLGYYNNNWWYVRNGRVDFNANTLGYYNNNWWYVRNGRVDFNANTLGYYNNNWWYVKNGCVDFNANTLAYYNNNWWYVKNGHVDFTANTIAENEKGLWYVNNGVVDFGYNGTFDGLDGKVYYIKNGLVYMIEEAE